MFSSDVAKLDNGKEGTSLIEKPGAVEKTGLGNYSQVKEPVSKQGMFPTSGVGILKLLPSGISELEWSLPGAS